MQKNLGSAEFWAGSIIGVMGGVIGNFLVNGLESARENPNMSNILFVILALVIFVIIIGALFHGYNRSLEAIQIRED
jgi:hypothetical protein